MSEFATVAGSVAALLLALTWVGYPVVMEVLARLVPRAPSALDDFNRPFVSVIIATRGPTDLVVRRLANLKSTSYPADKLEVVVGVDQAAHSELASVAHSADRDVRFVFTAVAPGKPSALNAAVEASRGEVLVFADSAQNFEPDALEQLVKSLADPRVGAVSGQLSLGSATRHSLVGLYWQMERRLRANEARVHSSVGVTGAIYAIRRELFTPIPADTILDDVYVPMRIVLGGRRVAFNSKARATDQRGYSISREKDRKERTLAGVLQLCVQIPRLLNPARNPIWIQFVMHKLMRLASPILILAMIPWGALALSHTLSVLPATISRALSVSLVAGAALILLVPRSRALLLELLLINWAVLRALGRAIRRDWGVW